MEVLKRFLLVSIFLLPLRISGAQTGLPPEYTRVQKHPHSSRALFELGEYYYRNEAYYQALPLYLLAQKNGKNDAYLYLKLGRCYNKLDHPDLALPLFQKGISLFPYYSSLYTSQAHSLYLLGRYPESLRSWKKGLSKGRKDAWNYSYVYSGMAKVYRELNDYTNSKRYFELSLRYRDNFWTHYEYAKLLEKLGLDLEAAGQFKLARNREKDQAEKFQSLIREKEASIYMRLALRFKKEKDWKLSREYLNRIVSDPDLEQTGSYEKALFWLNRIPMIGK